MEITGEKKYPTPGDLEGRSDYNTFKDLVSLKEVAVQGAYYLPLRVEYVLSAVTSNTYFSINGHRIFLNLGHLEFSIMRYNYMVEKRNLGYGYGMQFDSLRDEYFKWVHFRILFMLIDIAMSSASKEIIDKKYLRDDILRYLPNNEKNS